MSVRLVSQSIWGNRGNRGQRLRRTISAIWWQWHKRWVRTPVEIRLANGRTFLAHPDCGISSALMYSDYPEFFELKFIRSNLKRGDIVIDVGANVGHIGLLVSDIVDPGDIYAFEPTPLTFRRLRQNWEANGFPLPHLYEIAIGSQCGEAYIHDAAHPDSMNSIVAESIQADPTLAKVPLRTLDSFREEWDGQRIGLIKIDVEGFEPDVFEGALQVLSDDRPRMVMFESLRGQVEPRVACALDVAGYVVFQLDDRGHCDFSKANAQNLFAVPTEHRAAFERASACVAC